MDQGYIRCAQCGHDFPAAYLRSRDQVVCGCGMHIVRPGPTKAPASGLTLLLLVMAAVLLTAGAALLRRLLP